MLAGHNKNTATHTKPLSSLTHFSSHIRSSLSPHSATNNLHVFFSLF